ncbi:MAG TPA: DUF6516 family protein [Candidatus Binatia bacterium]|nr:DUF6516 family protein [Candidatus Binatia bacterium]
MRVITQYFALIASVAERSGAASVEVEFDQIDQVSGIIDGTLYFYDGSRLEFTERVAIEERHPVKSVYRYQYVRAGEAVLRYDNASHHPDLPTFPHHKHVGNERMPAAEPTLSQVLNEVASLLGEEAEAPPPAPRRQRRARR